MFTIIFLFFALWAFMLRSCLYALTVLEKGYDFAMRYNIDFYSISGKMKIGVDDIFYGYISKIDKKEISQLFFVLDKQDDYAKKIERSSCY